MAEDDEVKTLFVAGLPDDVREREIYNLFRVYEGYVSCQLSSYTDYGFQAVAFVVFKDQSSALKAKAALNGIKLDTQLPQTLHIELADSKFQYSQSEVGHPVPARLQENEEGIGGTMHMPGIVHSIHNDISGFPHTQSGEMMVSNTFSVPDGNTGPVMEPIATPPVVVAGSNPPCSTLFVANLGKTCSERELLEVFARCPGFRRLKTQLVDRMPVAFVEFQDMTCSTQALMQLQNMMLPSSEIGGMRIEYAKSKMGLPRRERGAHT
ncbi:hypothetical protein O6H91_06G105500 [Diphasiastrum complanatum]|uniref:Uncharacterized protein n=1 Tax=Diphasiastrum complanatum TaxID=34168 RepID=A0ACC2DH13_DIPCM|nr:hypothetical protein O6H91_06G105500 [Diphasiastrum complanatum]